MYKSIRIVLIALLTLLVLGGGAWLYLRTSLPQTRGAVDVAGIDRAIEIVRDEDGVPHIFAATDHDAYFALGYVHAQDRLWQMEMSRRIGAGRLSEVLGEATLETDKFLRTLGVYRAAESAWDSLSPDGRAALQAYADGVNAWLADDHTLPVEFLILRVEPEPWRVTDSLVWQKMMAWDMSRSYDTELLRMWLIQALGAERAAQILPPYPVDGLSIMDAADADALLQLGATLEQHYRLGSDHSGSNNWVIAGEHTASGLPLLANDPHLGARIPSVWYLAELQGDTLHVSGATLPGIPGVVLGHNEQIAWGVTNVTADVQDLYVERINPANFNQYEADGEWVDMAIVEELIVVRGQDEPIRWAARSTRHGPLISDVTSTSTPLAMRWIALDSDDTTLEAFLRTNRAVNWDEFVAAMRAYVVPSMNFVYADRAGNIGYMAPGRIPIRARGNGMTPAPGWSGEYEWVDEIPFEALPQVFNPPRGYILTANNRIVDDEYPHLISTRWAEPYRAERITELIETLLAADAPIALSDFAAMQADVQSTQTSQLLPLLLQVEPETERETQALTILRNWDGVHDGGRAAPALYEAWIVHLANVLFADDLSDDLFARMQPRRHARFLADTLAPAGVEDIHALDSPWCDNVLTAAPEACADAAHTALEQALDDLTERLGRNMEHWRWESVHRIQYPHMPFSEVTALRPFFHRSIANGGNTYTVNVATVDGADPYNQHWTPGYRQLIDLANLNASLFMQNTGQSGNVLSRHYDDLIEPHRNVEYRPMHVGRGHAAGDVLVLRPAP